MHSDVLNRHNIVLPARLRNRLTEHTNGHGLIAPGTSITDEVFVSADSVVVGGTLSGAVRIENGSIVAGSKLKASSHEPIRVYDSYVCGAHFFDAPVTIKGSELTDVKYSRETKQIVDGEVTQVQIEGSVLTIVNLEGRINIGLSVVENCQLSDVIVAGHSLTAMPDDYGRPTPMGTLANAVVTVEKLSIGSLSKIDLAVLKEAPLAD